MHKGCFQIFLVLFRKAWMMFDVNVYLTIHTSRGFDRNCHSKNHGGYVAGYKIDMQACYKKRC